MVNRISVPTNASKNIRLQRDALDGAEFGVDPATFDGAAFDALALMNGFINAEGANNGVTVAGNLVSSASDATVQRIGAEFLVNTTTRGGQFQPSVSMLANGNFVVTWTDTSRTGGFFADAIRGQLFDTAGNKVGNEFLINSRADLAARKPHTTALANGGFVVTFQSESDQGGEITAQLFDAHGGKVGNEIQVNSAVAGTQEAASITTLTNGRFVITWEDSSHQGGDTSGTAIKAQLFEADGKKLGSEFLVNTTTARAQNQASVTALANGRFVVTWEDASRQGGDQSVSAVKAQIFNADGSKFNGEFLVNTTTSSSQDAPQITALASGGFVVAWEDFSGRGDGSSGSIKAQIFNADGTNSGSELLVNTVTDGAQITPKITALTNGNFVVIWDDNGSPDGTIALKAQVFDGAGNKIGGEFQVNSAPEHNRTFASITALADGGFIVTWSDSSDQNSDGEGFAVKAQIFKVGGSNAAPIDEVLAGDVVAENAANDTIIGVVTGIDPNAGDRLSYTLVDSADGRFAIDADTGVITVADGRRLDFETNSAHNITVRATDQDGLSVDKTFAIKVTDVNEAPADETLTGDSVVENSPNGTVVGTVRGVDPDTNSVLTFELTDDAGGRFRIDASSGVITVVDGSLLNFETAPSHDITVRLTDQDGLSFDKTFTIHVINQNEGPQGEVLDNDTVSENSPNGTLVATVTGIDPEPGAVLTYALTNDAGGRFAIDANTGAITVADSALLDFETASAHDIAVRVMDQNNLSFEKAFTIRLRNVNEAPSDALLSNDTIAEDSPNGTAVGTVHGSDPDANDILTYSLVDSLGNPLNGGPFAIDARTGIVTVADSSQLDFETHPTETINVKITDQGGLSIRKQFTIRVGNTNEPPVAADAHASTSEDSSVAVPGPSLLALASDPDGGPLTLSSVGNATHGSVSLSNGNAIFVPDLNFSGVAGFDYTVSDADGNKTTAHVTVDVTPVANTPALLAGQLVAGKAGSQFQLNTTTGQGGQFKPSITQLADGRFVATWNDTSRTGGFFGDAIRGQIFDANGNKLGGEFLVNKLTTTGQSNQDDSKITALTGGGFVVTWEGSNGDGNGLGVKAQVFDANGAKVGDELTVNTQTLGDQDGRAIAALAGGGFVITWTDPNGDGSSNSVKGQRFDAEGNRVGDEFLVNTTTIGSQKEPSVTRLMTGPAVGGFVVTWSDDSGTGSDPNAVRAQIFNADGTKFGGEFFVNSQTASLQSASFVTTLANGNFVVTWLDFSGLGGDASGDGIKAQIFDSAGGKIGSEFLVNTATAGGQSQPSITALANGDFVVVWTDPSGVGGDASVSAIKAQVFSADGVRLGGEFLVNTITNSEQKDPTVTALGPNGFVVAWTDSNFANGVSGGVQGQIFTLLSTNEDTALPLNIAAAVTDIDGSESLAVAVSGIPVGATLSDGVHTFISVTGDTSVDVSSWNMANITVTPPLNFTGNFQLAVSATAIDMATLSDGSQPTSTRSVLQTFNVLVTPPTLTGGMGNDVLGGTAASDVLVGSGGNDLYQFGRGSGQDHIVNGMATETAPHGELDFGANISADQLWFQQTGNDLTISIVGSTDQMTIDNWFGSNASQLAHIRTVGGSLIDAGVAQLVQAMATYASENPGFDPAAAAQMPNDTGVQNAIAAQWHH
ncbi:MAG TPA: cadherin domain-containing protein [Pseudolabrys sp.]|nr:cadherin domain-containing protein [Pseudolabrys sp.]